VRLRLSLLLRQRVHAEVARLTALLHAPTPSTESAAIIDDLCAAIAPTTESVDSPAAAPTPEPNASSAESKPGPNTPEAPAAAPAVEPERTESPLAQLPFRDRVNAFLPVAGGVALVLIALLTLGSVAFIAGGSILPPILISSFVSTGSPNAVALSLNADFSSVVATGTDLVRAAAASAAYHTFADVRARSAAFNWIYSVLTGNSRHSCGSGLRNP
jgi:hypothetical protein